MPVFLLRVLDLLALVGLFVQAFVAWVFVALFASIRRRVPQTAFRTFLWAFVALAVALSAMSARFFRAHDVASSYQVWVDGQPLPVLCYALYTALKFLFGALLVRGSLELGGRSEPRWHAPARAALVAAGAAAPLVLPAVDDLLVLQAPVMVACALLALRALRDLGGEAGLAILRLSLVGLAVSWTVHALAVLESQRPVAHVLLSLNSFLDLGVQLLLGAGLVVGLLQDAHRRLLDAERERERLAREIERGERLRALGTVVSGVAHELNNPLTVILAYAEELERREASRVEAAIVVEQAERCRGIVRNLSALAGQSVHPREELDLEDLVRRVARGLAGARAGDAAERVRIEPMHGLRLAADRIGLEQVLANLLSNALDAGAPAGRVTVGARVEGGEVVLRVTDEGPGVPDELRERIFEPFFTTKAPGRGTGLGLSIAHGIVRGHRGTISVTSRPEGGAAFVVRLPHEHAGLLPQRPAPAPPAGERLLVVDDEPSLRSLVRRMAERRGWAVTEASSAEEALALPLEGVGAVLCDLRMPGIGGAGFCERLRAREPALSERVVYVTGDPYAPEAVAFQHRCGRPLLHKPFEEAELFDLLAEAAGSDALRA